MRGQQITPWSIYKEKGAHSPFKIQNKVIKKKEKSKLNLPQIEGSLYAMQMIVKSKLQNQQLCTLKKQENKTTPLIASINKIIRANRKASDSESLKNNSAQQNSKTKQIEEEKQAFLKQAQSFLTLKMLYQELRNQEEKSKEKVQISSEVVQMLKSESEALVLKEQKFRKNELFPDITGGRIHKSIQDISQDKIKEVLNKSAAYKISQRLKFLWQGKSKCTSFNK